jgi:hypothetical protein
VLSLVTLVITGPETNVFCIPAFKPCACLRAFINYASTLKKTCADSNTQEKQVMPDLQDQKLTTTTTPALFDQQIENVALLDELKSTKTALSDQRLEIADIQDTMNSESANISEQHKMDLAAIKEDRKLEMKAL